MQYSFHGKKGKCYLLHICCCVLLFDFFKGMLRRIIEHFLKKRIHEKLGISEMK